MKVYSVWTHGEGYNVLYALRKRFGPLAPETLIKRAVREYVETLRKERLSPRRKVEP